MHHIIFESNLYVCECNFIFSSCFTYSTEHVTPQHKAVVFVVHMQKRKEVKTGQEDYQGWKRKDNVTVKYKETVKATYK